jgi:hypothetical protein
MELYRKIVGGLVLVLWGVAIGLTLNGSTVSIPWSLHIAAVGVLGWVFGPIFWQGIGPGARGERGANELMRIAEGKPDERGAGNGGQPGA